MDLSVVIPCLNEEKTIAICIEKCIKAFEQLGIQGEVIVSDNGSDDNSVQASSQAGAKVVRCQNKGYGNALLYGFKNANGKYILMGDADNSYDFSLIPHFYTKLYYDTDMIIGSRLKGGIEKGAMPFLHRYLGTPVITWILNILFNTKISDSQSGMRLLKKESLEQIVFHCTGMDFATELLVEFTKHKFKIIEIPIKFYKSIDGRTPHLRPFRDGMRILKYLFKARFYPNKIPAIQADI